MITIKDNTYTIHTSAFDVKMLIKNDKPVLFIPEELVEDFIQILSYAGAGYKLSNYSTLKTTEND